MNPSSPDRLPVARTRRALVVTTIPAMHRHFLLPIAQHFRALGWRVDAVADEITRCEECTRTYDHVYDASLSRNPLRPGNVGRAPAQLRQIVEEGGYDLVHVHTPVAAFVTRYALRRLRARGQVRVIYTAHGFHFFEGNSGWRNFAFSSLERLAARWMDDLVVMNSEDYQAALRYRMLPAERIHFMPGIGVDLARYGAAAVSEAAVERVRAELGLSAQDRLFLMTAEFLPRKRHADALEALARLGRADVHLAFAGIGRLEPEVRAQAQALGLSRRVHFLGFRKDVPVLLRAATGNLLVSTQEGLPRAVMEAMSVGVPTIGTDIRGVRDLLDNGCGLIVPPRDPAALAEAMRRVLDAPEEAATWVVRAREKIQHYDLRHILALHERLYGEPGSSAERRPLRAAG